jgi:hypothetical protein
MKPLRSCLAAAAVLVLAGCGRVSEMTPAPGQSLPVRPQMARATPTASELLALPPYAKPDRIDELVKRSEARAEDPFDLPPPTGGAAPTVPVNPGD